MTVFAVSWSTGWDRWGSKKHICQMHSILHWRIYKAKQVLTTPLDSQGCSPLSVWAKLCVRINTGRISASEQDGEIDDLVRAIPAISLWVIVNDFTYYSTDQQFRITECSSIGFPMVSHAVTRSGLVHRYRSGGSQSTVCSGCRMIYGASTEVKLSSQNKLFSGNRADLQRLELE